MDIQCITHFSKRKTADAIVFPFWQQKGKAEEAFRLSAKFDNDYTLPIKCNDFTGKSGDLVSLYFDKGTDKRAILLGLGEKENFSLEEARIAFAQLSKYAQEKKFTHLNVVVPENITEDYLEAICEGISLPNYIFDAYKDLKDKRVLLKTVYLIGAKQWNREANQVLAVTEAVHFTRNLVNTNADEVNPLYLASETKRLFRGNARVDVQVFDKKAITSMKMGLLLAVNRGSQTEPRLIIASYKGAPKSKEHTVLVGKGVTYDTGGLNLKPTGSMESMKSDMSGAAAVLGSLKAIVDLQLPVNVTAVIPSTENGIDAASYKPGDCYKGYSGLSVEIGNTDAEGRLILADALAYSVKKLKPTQIIDFATLTGAVIIALGEEVSGLMSNNDSLAHELEEAGNQTYERLWRLPLVKEYRKHLDSKIADIKNVGERAAGTITAGLFLQEFVDDIPWAHLDIAGTAFPGKLLPYQQATASGVGVRLMVRYFRNKLFNKYNKK